MAVFTFAFGRFSEKQLDDENIDPPLPARYFTSRFRYYISACVFAGVYAFAFVGFIFLGSFPQFQTILTDWIGSVAGKEGAEVGTPAWAAMVITVVAPTVPKIRRLETALRYWLQEFSDTPFKARVLADEIVRALLSSDGVPTDLADASETRLMAAFEKLEVLRQQLTTSGRPKLDRHYRKFLTDNGDVLSRTITSFKTIQDDLDALRPSSATVPVSHRIQMALMVQRYARLLACALLYVESEEYPARERLRATSALRDFPRAKFQFSAVQVFLGVIAIFVFAVIVGVSSHWLVLNASLRDAAEYWAPISAVLAFAFVLPLPLAAAIRLYLIDLAAHGYDTTEWLPFVGRLLFTFAGCFGLAALVTVAYRVGITHMSGAGAFDQTALILALLWAVPPAIVNTTFVVLSGVRLVSARKSAAVDFLTFAALGGISALLVGIVQALEHEPVFALMLWGLVPYIITVTLVSGLYGALQCAASRTVETATMDGAGELAEATGLSETATLPTR